MNPDYSPVKKTGSTKCRIILALLVLCTLSTYGQTDPNAFITTWKTTTAGEAIIIPTHSSSIYSYTVNWGDGMEDTGVTGNASHTYTVASTYRVSITGTFPRIYFGDVDNTSLNADKIQTIVRWGDRAWASMRLAFTGCSKLTSSATDVPDLSGVTSMFGMFAFASAFNQDISVWNVSSVENMSFMFSGASAFNQDISNWNVSSVTDMLGMFFDAVAFNQDISGWNVSKVTDMSYMFGGPEGGSARAFNQDIGNWNVSSVTDMLGMFFDAIAFNQDISGWNVSKVTNMSYMFGGPEGGSARAFNPDISKWDVSKVTDMSFMFNYAEAFNQDISGWNVSKVTNMLAMFQGASAFNQDISGWNVSKVTDISFMFNGATPFNQDISNWNVSKVTDMRAMFQNAISFNQDISNWKVSKVTDMSFMFFGASAFNQDISGWDVSIVTDMRSMFNGASTFNQDISGWNVENVTDFLFFLSRAELSPGNYDNILVGWRALDLMDMLTFNAGNSRYTSTGATARAAIETEETWMITDGGPVGEATTFAENTTGTVTNINTDDSGIMYALVDPTTVDRNDDDNALFNIDGSTGELTFVNLPDFESPQDAGMNNIYAAEVTVMEGSDVTKVTVSVSVTNVNEPPVVTEISDMSLTEGLSSGAIDLGAAFTDPDAGDALTFTASSGVEVATEITGSTLTLTAGSMVGGPYAVTVTAEDRDGLTVNDMFNVTVTANRSPVVTAPGISDRSLVEGLSSGAIDLEAVFMDPDAGDMLTFTATSGVEVATEITGSMLTLTAGSMLGGPYVVTVTARDIGDLTVSHMFNVTVTANSPPVVTPTGISDLSLVEGFGTEDIDLEAVFTDPDAGDALTFTVSTSSPLVVTAEITGSTLTLTAGSMVGGPYVVTVNAEDRGGLAVSDMFEVTVTANTAPVVVATGISDLSLMEGFGIKNIELAGTFTDPDAGDVLTLTASSANRAAVTTAIAGTMLTIIEVGPGSSGITVTAEDRNGGMVTDEFTVTVEMVTGVAETGRSLRAYPNPGSESLTVEMEGTWSLVRIYDFTGRHLHVPVREQGPKKVVLDISGLPGGIYLVKVSGGGHSTVHRLIVEHRQKRF